MFQIYFSFWIFWHSSLALIFIFAFSTPGWYPYWVLFKKFHGPTTSPYFHWSTYQMGNQMGKLINSTFSFPRSHFECPSQNKILKLQGLSKIVSCSYVEIQCLPFWPTCTCEKNTTTVGKANGLKRQCYWKHLGEQIGIIVNFMRTPWELDGNITGTRKNQKIYKSETEKGEEGGGRQGRE